MSGASLEEARVKLTELASDSDDVRAFLDFIESGERPLVR
jgi:UDP-N-acetylglucosamine acyltransferase